MKPLSLQRTHGFTRVELLVVILVLIVLFILFAPLDFFYSGKSKAQQLACLDNLHQIGRAYRIWAGDHGDSMPASTSITNGGWEEFLKNPNQGAVCWTNYAIIAVDLGGAPRMLLCPADDRNSAEFFTTGGKTNEAGVGVFKDNATLSYFVAPDASDKYPAGILGGDRNLGPGTVPHDDYGYSPSNGQGNDVIINGPVCWSLKMHSAGDPAGLGNILLGDGSGQKTSTATFNTFRMNAEETSTNHPGIRLIFP